MKKILFIIIAFFTLPVGLSSINTIESNKALEEIIDNIVDERVVIFNSDYEVYGNSVEFSSTSFEQYVDSAQARKIYVLYRSNYNVELPYDLILYVKTSKDTYQYEYSCSEQKQAYLIPGIKNYLKNYSNEILGLLYSNEVMPLSNEVPTSFVDACTTQVYTIDFPKKGFITSRIAVLECKATEKSSVFIIKAISTFVPGYAAKQNNLNYDAWRNDSGYVHMTVQQAYDSTEEAYYGKRYGAIPYFKDYKPCNQNIAVNVSSSFGGEIGVSKEDGFYIDGVLAYPYSKLVNVTEPQVNSIFLQSSNTGMWSYTNGKIRSHEYNHESIYIYEISKDGHDLFYGDVRLTLDYRFLVDRSGFYTQHEYFDSLDLIVRPSSQRIYRFCGGQI